MPVLIDGVITGKLGKVMPNVVSSSEDPIPANDGPAGMRRVLNNNTGKVGSAGSVNYRSLKPRNQKDTLILSLQNGVEATPNLREFAKGGNVSVKG